jgi:hypothetical protein
VGGGRGRERVRSAALRRKGLCFTVFGSDTDSRQAFVQLPNTLTSDDGEIVARTGTSRPEQARADTSSGAARLLHMQHLMEQDSGSMLVRHRNNSCRGQPNNALGQSLYTQRAVLRSTYASRQVQIP